MRALKRLAIIFFAVSVFGCQQNRQQEKNIQTQSAKSDEAFTAFLTKFNRDSTFQKTRIVFPFKVIQTEWEDGGDKDKTVLIQQGDWTHVDFSFPGDKKNIVKQIDNNKDEVNILLQVEDTGVYVEHFFQKKQGQWWLVYVRDSST